MWRNTILTKRKRILSKKICSRMVVKNRSSKPWRNEGIYMCDGRERNIILFNPLLWNGIWQQPNYSALRFRDTGNFSGSRTIMKGASGTSGGSRMQRIDPKRGRSNSSKHTEQELKSSNNDKSEFLKHWNIHTRNKRDYRSLENAWKNNYTAPWCVLKLLRA